MFRKSLITAFAVLALATSSLVSASDYMIDTAHTSIKFKIAHLGYSWLYGRFNTFNGSYSYDENNLADSKVSVEIDTASVDSSHAERDKHLRSDDFLHASKYPKANFVSTSYQDQGNGNGKLNGNLTLHGVTRPITIDVMFVGAGKDPWGKYRTGFSGSTKLTLKDFGITKNLGPASTQLELILDVEGIRQ